jgi:dihydrolipoamide dehydrogenase
MDSEIAAEAHKVLAKQGLAFQLGVRVTGARATKAGAIVEIDGKSSIECDRVLVAVGRAPYTDGLGLEAIGLALDNRGRIPVDAHFQTSVPNVYAIGDVIAGPMLAHKASEEGVACVEHIATGYGHVNYDAIPSVVYTAPEVASVGKTEEELKAAGRAYKKGAFPFMANGRAKALGHTEGKVKVLADATTDRVLGVHIVGPRAGDLIAEAVAAIEFGASSEDVARTCHAHPTLAEVFKEAALAVDGRAIHFKRGRALRRRARRRRLRQARAELERARGDQRERARAPVRQRAHDREPDALRPRYHRRSSRARRAADERPPNRDARLRRSRRSRPRIVREAP